jgi:hypothetical protein
MIDYRVVCFAYGRKLGRSGCIVDDRGQLREYLAELFAMLSSSGVVGIQAKIAQNWRECEILIGVGIGHKRKG